MPPINGSLCGYDLALSDLLERFALQIGCIVRRRTPKRVKASMPKSKKAKPLVRRIEAPPFETEELRRMLKAFLEIAYDKPKAGKPRTIGSFKWGVYIFYDYDNEPIYVGQTKERISQRIGRHLTNQRTDAVAMSVLDPFEVYRIRAYPLPQFQHVGAKHRSYKRATAYLNELEYRIHRQAQKKSNFKAILNEKDPVRSKLKIKVPRFVEDIVVSEDVANLRKHPDVRIARRAQVIARLSQTISERQVKSGLRRTLVTQATRLRSLAQRRYSELGGRAIVEAGPEDSEIT